MQRFIVITGTDTGVGKTVLTALLASHLRARGFSVAALKPFIDNLERLKVTYTNLKGDGKEPAVRVDGVKQIYLQDPDGYWIEINDAK